MVGSGGQSPPPIKPKIMLKNKIPLHVKEKNIPLEINENSFSDEYKMESYEFFDDIDDHRIDKSSQSYIFSICSINEKITSIRNDKKFFDEFKDTLLINSNLLILGGIPPR
jgi:hypothetical protein